MTKTEQFEAKVAAITDAELAEKCDRELIDLCKTGGDSFLMSIPPWVNDTDILFSELIKRFKSRDKWISVKERPIKPEDMEVVAFHPDWIDPDFNPKGTRAGFVTDNDTFRSVRWNDYHGEYIEDDTEFPTHYMFVPEPPKEEKK